MSVLWVHILATQMPVALMLMVLIAVNVKVVITGMANLVLLVSVFVHSLLTMCLQCFSGNNKMTLSVKHETENIFSSQFACF
jgi:hypothetical protein